MKNFFRKLLVVCSLLAPAVYAADWKFDGWDGQYDAASIVREGDLVQVWVQVPRTPDVLERWSVDCKNNTASRLAYVERKDGVAKEFARPYDKLRTYRPIPPDTRGASIKAIVCKPWYWPF